MTLHAASDCGQSHRHLQSTFVSKRQLFRITLILDVLQVRFIMLTYF